MKEIKETKSKKYWYIQLNVNFFDDERIDWLCDQQNGYAYVVLYLKLCLKTANNNGILTRQIGDVIIPYDIDKIAEMTHINVDIVRVALELYKRIGLVYEADENCNFMRLPEVPKMVGYTTQAALEKAQWRTNKKEKEALKALSDKIEDDCPDNVRDKCLEDAAQEYRVKSIELRDNNNSNTNTHPFQDVNTPTSGGLPTMQSKTVENSVETVGMSPEEEAAQIVMKYFLFCYSYRFKRNHEPIPPEKVPSIRKAITENGLTRKHVNAYFGDNGAGGTKPLYGDSDAKIYHFVSPGVVEILKLRCGE